NAREDFNPLLLRPPDKFRNRLLSDIGTVDELRIVHVQDISDNGFGVTFLLLALVASVSPVPLPEIPVAAICGMLVRVHGVVWCPLIAQEIEPDTAALLTLCSVHTVLLDRAVVVLFKENRRDGFEEGRLPRTRRLPPIAILSGEENKPRLAQVNRLLRPKRSVALNLNFLYRTH